LNEQFRKSEVGLRDLRKAYLSHRQSVGMEEEIAAYLERGEKAFKAFRIL
jgi:hypothetical protein